MESDLAPIFGDLSRNEKISEIEPPLPGTMCPKQSVAFSYIAQPMSL